MNLKEITIVFENCESLTYAYPNVSYFQIYGYHETFGNYANAISKNKVINGFEMIIRNPDECVAECLFGGCPSQRLGNDITQLSIKYDNDISETLFVKWAGDSFDTFHNSQTIHTTDKGVVYINSAVETTIEKPTDEWINYRSIL